MGRHQLKYRRQQKIFAIKMQAELVSLVTQAMRMCVCVQFSVRVYFSAYTVLIQRLIPGPADWIDSHFLTNAH